MFIRRRLLIFPGAPMDERRPRALDERMIRGGRGRGRRRHRRDSCVTSVVARRGVVAVRAGGKPRAPRVGLVRVAYAFAQAQAAESPARELQRPLEERGEAAGVEEIAHLHGRHRAALERERDVGDVEKPDRADGDAHAAAARDANLPSGGGRREGGKRASVKSGEGGRGVAMSADSNSAPAEGDIWDPTIDARDPRRSATHREGQERGQEQPRAQPHEERERHRRERGERRDARHRARPRSRAPRSRW